ncbi:high-affinity iron permease [Tulasnella sp. 424]|nr:high-affinity iron permease [Tulasnella sp. 424]KAG8962844.1 high-affinity iron permease [Tulasnella sp. 425]
MTAVFSVPIFFIVFREALEASIIISVLLALVEQIVQQPGSGNTTAVARERTTDSEEKKREGSHTSESEDLALGSPAETHALVKKMRVLVFAGSITGLFVALAIGAAFLAVWFTQVNDLFAANEEIWEGTFNLIAAILIFVMGLTMLRIDKSKAKWRAKLHKAFLSDVANTAQGPTSKWAKWNPFRGGRNLSGEDKWEMSSGKWALFLLPFITVMREGLEAVVFIGGVSLGQKATAIPLAAIIGLLCGLIVGFIIYKSSSRTSISIFLIISTNLLLLVGAGLFSKSIGSFQRHKFNKMVGADVAEAGNGPGSYDVRGNIWHLNCCNPEDKYGNGGWAIFAAIFGWSNDGSVGTVLGYIFYWIAVVVALVIMQINEKKNRSRAAAQTA